MNASIFNFHDLVLIVTSIGAFILGISLILFPKKKRPSRKFLAGFFLCESLTNITNLFFWHSLLRQFSIQNSEIVTLIYITVSLTKGAMLYYYVLSILDNGFTLSKRQSLHLMASPTIAVVLVMSGFGVLHIAAGVPFSQVDQVSYSFAAFLFFVPWAYAIRCAGEISRMDNVLRGFYSSTIESGTTWFKLLVYGYIVVWSWQLFTQLFSGYLSTVIDGGLPNVFGLISNYLDFGLLFALYAYSVSRAYGRLAVALDTVEHSSDLVPQTIILTPASLTITSTDDIDNKTPEPSSSTRATPSFETNKKYQVCADKLSDAMERKKIYLDHAINLERVSDRIGEKPKDVSHVLHTHFKTSFFEFINGYRVAEAKHLLTDDLTLSVNEVMERSGFSSKSAFHRVFKSATQKTPHQYRNETRQEPKPSTPLEIEDRDRLSLSL